MAVFPCGSAPQTKNPPDTKRRPGVQRIRLAGARSAPLIGGASGLVEAAAGAVHGDGERQVLNLHPLDGLAAQVLEGDDLRRADAPGDQRARAAHRGEVAGPVAAERGARDEARQTQEQLRERLARTNRDFYTGSADLTASVTQALREVERLRQNLADLSAVFEENARAVEELCGEDK